MKLLRLAAAAAVSLAPSFSSAQDVPHDCVADPPLYHDLRQQHAGIDDAVADMPSSDLHGTFNRLDALFHRAQVEGLACGAGDAGEVPANVLRNLEATLDDLASDLGGTALDGLDDAQTINLLQVVRIYGFRRTLALFQSNESADCGGITFCNLPPEQCPSPPPPCVDDDPAVFESLDGVVASVSTEYRRLYLAVVAANGGVAPAGLVHYSQLNVNTYSRAIVTIRPEVASLVGGVESIDD